ncbi:TPA_asm: P [Schiedea betacytorhabdovirus 1]|nr:TPA_asm: P [Schiedea betacytorhabdovirus 1]
MSESPLTPFTDIPEGPAMKIDEIKDLLSGEAIFQKPEDAESSKSEVGEMDEPKEEVVPTRTKDDIDLGKPKVQFQKGRIEKRSAKTSSLPKQDQSQKASGSKEKIGTKPKSFEKESDPDEQLRYTDSKTMLRDFSVICKSEGIIPMSEYQDVLSREMSTSSGYLTERDLRLFVLGVRSEKLYSSQQLLKDTISSLSQEVSKLVKTQKMIEESRRQLVSAMDVHEKKMVEIVKDTIREEYQSFEEQEEEVEEEKEEKAKPSAPDPKEKYNKTALQISKPGSSKFSQYTRDLKIPAKGVEDMDVSALKVPEDAEEFLPIAMIELGLDEDMAEDEEKMDAVLYGPTYNEKVILFNGLASDELKEAICSKISLYYESEKSSEP